MKRHARILLLLIFLLTCLSSAQTASSSIWLEELEKVRDNHQFVGDFLSSHPHPELELFLLGNPWEYENLNKIVKIQSPFEYFEFFDHLAAVDKKFMPLSFHCYLQGLFKCLQSDPQRYHPPFCNLIIKSEGYFAEMLADRYGSFIENQTCWLICHYPEFKEYDRVIAHLESADWDRIRQCLGRIKQIRSNAENLLDSFSKKPGAR